jgi:hypothetical protein
MLLSRNRHSRPFANARAPLNPSNDNTFCRLLKGLRPSRATGGLVRKVETGRASRGVGGETARAHTIFSILVLLWFWGTALLVALNDIDFFSLSDLLDTAHPHHEHVVVALLIGGSLVSAFIFWRGRAGPAPA